MDSNDNTISSRESDRERIKIETEAYLQGNKISHGEPLRPVLDDKLIKAMGYKKNNACEDNAAHFMGEPCKICGGRRRYKKSHVCVCCASTKAKQRKARAKNA